jgi:DNA replication protein DnaC
MAEETPPAGRPGARGGKPRIVIARDFRTSAADAPRSAPALPCNLRKAMPCCGGRGYQIVAKGAFTRAQVCECVQACAGCGGLARRDVGDASTACRTPSPNVVVNLVNAAEIPARYAQASLERFSNFSGNGRAFRQRVLEWKARFTPIGSPGLVIEGPVGVGKTFVLASLAKELAERGLSVRFTDFFQLLAELKAGFAQGRSDGPRLEPLIDVDVLVIDEVGKGRNTDFELTVLDQLVSARYNQNKTIIASTNYLLKRKSYDYNVELDRHDGGGPADFASERFDALETRVGPRIFSRLREMTLFLELTGDDLRRRDA